MGQSTCCLVSSVMEIGVLTTTLWIAHYEQELIRIAENKQFVQSKVKLNAQLLLLRTQTAF